MESTFIYILDKSGIGSYTDPACLSGLPAPSGTSTVKRLENSPAAHQPRDRGTSDGITWGWRIPLIGKTGGSYVRAWKYLEVIAHRRNSFLLGTKCVQKCVPCRSPCGFDTENYGSPPEIPWTIKSPESEARHSPFFGQPPHVHKADHCPLWCAGSTRSH